MQVVLGEKKRCRGNSFDDLHLGTSYVLQICTISDVHDIQRSVWTQRFGYIHEVSTSHSKTPATNGKQLLPSFSGSGTPESQPVQVLCWTSTLSASCQQTLSDILTYPSNRDFGKLSYFGKLPPSNKDSFFCIAIPVVPHKAVAGSFKIGKL